jgi:hypothetical protein
MTDDRRESSFDELAKGLASGEVSRGKAIRWMGGALLGAALASVPGVAWANDCRRLGRECRRDSQCCYRNCVRRGDDKVCTCPQGQTRCNDRCVNLETNERHCGRCSNRCPEESECVGGVCQGSCPPGEPVCGNRCCEGGRECVGGVCQCPSGTTECDRTVGEGPPGPQCVPDCPQGQVLNTKRCQCVVPTGGTNVACICGDFSERVACFPGSTCPEFRDDFCREVCGSAGLVNTACTPDDIC